MMKPDNNEAGSEEEILAYVRRVCKKLAESVVTIDGFGHTVFRVAGKPFARIGGMDGHPTLSFKCSKESQEILLQQETGYYKTPYIGQHGWVSTDHPEFGAPLEELITEAYLHAAPRRLVKQLME